MAEVYVFFADGFEEIEGLTVVDLLRRAKVPVHMVSIQGKQAKGSHGIVIETEIGIAEVSEQTGDYLVLPGGMPGTKHLAACEALREKLLAAEKKGVHLAAICAAPSVFGNLGLLEGKKGVCYPGFEDQLKGAVTGTEEVAVDGMITTSRGMGTAIAFGLELIRQIKGEETAAQIGSSIIYRQ